ncbi:hypothetical protein [Neobacillus soli]|uniref:hypothetical protein n=1 Tax=Neobacillus soli TaxID=220688 RepID=UPI00082467C3|nr:hypothetical protein [Neobacillus soli]
MGKFDDLDALDKEIKNVIEENQNNIVSKRRSVLERLKTEEKKARGPKKKMETKLETFNLDLGILDVLNQYCNEEMIPKSQLVRQVLRKYFKELGKI